MGTFFEAIGCKAYNNMIIVNWTKTTIFVQLPSQTGQKTELLSSSIIVAQTDKKDGLELISP